jgi:hypothetical protein
MEQLACKRVGDALEIELIQRRTAHLQQGRAEHVAPRIGILADIATRHHSPEQVMRGAWMHLRYSADLLQAQPFRVALPNHLQNVKGPIKRLNRPFIAGFHMLLHFVKYISVWQILSREKNRVNHL